MDEKNNANVTALQAMRIAQDYKKSTDYMGIYMMT